MAAPRPTHSTIAGVPASNFQGRLVEGRLLELDRLDHLAAAQERRHLLEQLLAAPQRARAARAGQLVAREGEEVAAERLHVDRAVRRRLRAVDDHDRVARVRPVADLADGVERAERVRLVHDRDQAHAALALDRRELVEVEAAVVGHADVAQRRRPSGWPATATAPCSSGAPSRCTRSRRRVRSWRCRRSRRRG